MYKSFVPYSRCSMLLRQRSSRLIPPLTFTARLNSTSTPLSNKIFQPMARFFMPKGPIPSFDPNTGVFDMTTQCFEKGDEDDFYNLGVQRDLVGWTAISTLHIWMLNVRLRKEGKKGSEITQSILDQLFREIELRLIANGITSGLMLAKITKQVFPHYHGSIVAYDDGMLNGDVHLANAIFRNLFYRSTSEAASLGLIVKYIRMELNRMDNLSLEALIGDNFKFSHLPMTI
eukprot:TRINITY_DN1977_c0_g2_i1.p1 TRINITY_DN1977_c0_g2~~TRINITY_DN1977_c0_g2_i1.p1  ORF type:complete len:231 (+),score=24.47 TRINITY_DN1977_c0_g2_i1:32-724(+)